ncbi:hypothetical protein LF1_14010 [Rubripirellula obstinata]|uniref:Uncharacterized protein n=1 Tax=Rubripirellula obstinata TaxID=406547 RepID=A0A5B1CCM1_9BACT|nr:hypothetical protein LF1_14010 [Rubripirellula obstinata]
MAAPTSFIWLGFAATPRNRARKTGNSVPPSGVLHPRQRASVPPGLVGAPSHGVAAALCRWRSHRLVQRKPNRPGGPTAYEHPSLKCRASYSTPAVLSMPTKLSSLQDYRQRYRDTGGCATGKGLPSLQDYRQRVARHRWLRHRHRASVPPGLVGALSHGVAAALCRWRSHRLVQRKTNRPGGPTAYEHLSHKCRASYSAPAVLSMPIELSSLQDYRQRYR